MSIWVQRVPEWPNTMSKAIIRSDVGSGQSVARSGNDADPINTHGMFIVFTMHIQLREDLG